MGVLSGAGHGGEETWAHVGHGQDPLLRQALLNSATHALVGQLMLGGPGLVAPEPGTTGTSEVMRGLAGIFESRGVPVLSVDGNFASKSADLVTAAKNEVLEFTGDHKDSGVVIVSGADSLMKKSRKTTLNAAKGGLLLGAFLPPARGGTRVPLLVLGNERPHGEDTAESLPAADALEAVFSPGQYHTFQGVTIRAQRRVFKLDASPPHNEHTPDPNLRQKRFLANLGEFLDTVTTERHPSNLEEIRQLLHPSVSASASLNPRTF
jgi:hypothetical protein